MKSMKWFGFGILMCTAKVEVNGLPIPLSPLMYLILLLETREKFGKRKQIPLQVACLAGLIFSSAEWYMQIWAPRPWGDWTELVYQWLPLVITFQLNRAVSALAGPGPQIRRLWGTWAVMVAGNLVAVLSTLAISARAFPNGQSKLELLQMGASLVETVFLVCYLLWLGRVYRLGLERPKKTEVTSE